MNKEQKKKLSREKRRLQKTKRARLEKEIEDIEDMEDNDLDIPDDEDIEKEYRGDFNSISFSQLDAAMAAQEKVEKVNETTWMVRDLVNNILYNRELDVDEKASAIKSVADDFGARVRSIMDSNILKASIDLDALELQATLARDKRNLSFSERVKDMVSKAVLTASAENKLSDDDFALVETKDGKKVRKYPIHDKAHVRNALARAAQMIKAGGEAEADAKTALPKIRAAAKTMGIDVSIDKDANAIQIEKDANGDWRMVNLVSNKWLDRDDEIICEDAHKEYAEWVNSSPEFMPASMSWHIPETVRENCVDFVDYIDGFLITSVKLTEKEAQSLLEVSKNVDLGMSHGSFVLERDPNDSRIITKYRMYEVSDLPLKNAANPFTDLETISKEVGMDKLEYLSKIMGKEKAEAYFEKIGLKKQALEDAQIESKEVTEEVVETEPVAELEEKKVNEPGDVVAEVLKQLDIDGLNEFVTKAQEAMEKIPVLEELVKELSTNQEDKLAEMINPPISKKMAWSRPSESKENILKEGVKKDEKLKEQVPGIPEEMWLSQATGTVPIKVEETV